MTDTRAQRIAALNDKFRTQGPLAGVPGKMFAMAEIAKLPAHVQAGIIAKIQSYNTFLEGHDPYKERDFGAFEFDGVGKIFWKIDYYADRSMEWGSEDPSNPEKSFRVLTIMLAYEY